MNNDTIMKIAVGILTALVLGAYTWVWDTNEAVTINQLELNHLKEAADDAKVEQEVIVQEQREMASTIMSTQKRMYGMERDIEYIKQGIDEIKGDLKELKNKN